MAYKVKAPTGPAGQGPFLGTLKINDTADIEGWSEGYWIDKASHALALDWLYTKLWPARKGMLSSECVLVEANVSDSSVKGDSVATFPTEDAKHPESWNEATGASFAAAPNNVVLWYRMSGDNPSVRAVKPLHGIPMELLSPTNQAIRTYSYSSLFQAQFDKFAQRLIESVRMVKRTAIGGGPGGSDTIIWTPITTITLPNRTRYRKVGRPFGLLRGRLA